MYFVILILFLLSVRRSCLCELEAYDTKTNSLYAQVYLAINALSDSDSLLIVVFESLNCPQCEKMDLKIIQSLLERVQICRRCWKTEESAGPGGFF